MSRQHASPVLLAPGKPARALRPLPLGAGRDQISEADLQILIHEHPACLPIAEIDSLFAAPIPICMELNTPAGPIDNFMVTASGLPVLVECKLWRNPEGRREVVGQILDYAKELSRWSASDLQREVSRRVEREGNPILALLREADYDVDEITFNDALTHNLRRGRFLLLIVGDGIREGVEAIAEYLQAHAGLHFSFGLIEMPIYLTEDGARLVLPRVLARTQLITRTVVATPDGQAVLDDETVVEAAHEENDPLSRINFWNEFVATLELNDPEQRKPRAGRQGYVSLSLPVPGGSTWLTVYRSEARWEVGVYLSYTRDSIGERICQRLVGDWPTIHPELGGTASVSLDKLGRSLIEDHLQTGPWTKPAEKEAALSWLRARTNDFVNVLRPRIRAALADLQGES
ncbi:hypothetical protein HZY97_07400 [Sphingomonas sp. R-74633]|uniref:hypothetical protein n=1 Tax=Sphingomonas sp. R-74633 TaxID=2751188 RepID=UPI0015D13AF7|nr:hypothetical protein [Sphingomonas sp. R-74633]NYT40577.1 hypothetical protein [Sphingomonas sp. R-74633]